MKRCPKCGNNAFYVTAHIMQEWLVDENEDFTSVATDCLEVVYRPDDDDIWICSKCGYEASGKEFNYEEGDTTMNRIDKIKEFAVKEKEREKTEEEAKREENEKYVALVRNLRPRIQELINTANACLDNGIKIDGDRWNGKDPYNFAADGFYHTVGFFYNGCHPKHIGYMGIRAGGACGDLDFKTDGDLIVSVHEKTEKISKALTFHMEKFIKDFDDFEDRFYKYVDSKVN